MMSSESKNPGVYYNANATRRKRSTSSDIPAVAHRPLLPHRSHWDLSVQDHVAKRKVLVSVKQSEWSI